MFFAALLLATTQTESQPQRNETIQTAPPKPPSILLPASRATCCRSAHLHPTHRAGTGVRATARGGAALAPCPCGCRGRTRANAIAWPSRPRQGPGIAAMRVVAPCARTADSPGAHGRSAGACMLPWALLPIPAPMMRVHGLEGEIAALWIRDPHGDAANSRKHAAGAVRPARPCRPDCAARTPGNGPGHGRSKHGPRAFSCPDHGGHGAACARKSKGNTPPRRSQAQGCLARLCGQPARRRNACRGTGLNYTHPERTPASTSGPACSA